MRLASPSLHIRWTGAQTTNRRHEDGTLSYNKQEEKRRSSAAPPERGRGGRKRTHASNLRLVPSIQYAIDASSSKNKLFTSMDAQLGKVGSGDTHPLPHS